MNQSTVAPPYKRYARSFFLAFCLLQSASYACASQDMTEMRRLAEQGDAVAQADLGSAYYMGHGVPQNYKQALTWSLKAAEQGQAEAEYNLGIIYANGNGVVKDAQKANAWNRKAAEHGYATAQTNVGATYYLGQGVAQDYKEAMVWYRKAADQSDARAYLYLGNCYYRGKGVAQDYKEAALWFNRAAEQAKASSEPDIEKQAVAAARALENEQKSLEGTIASKQEQSSSSPEINGAEYMRAILISRYKQSPMTEDQFDRFSKQANYKLTNKFSDFMVQYLIGQATIEQADKNQKILIMEAKLSGETLDSLDNEIVDGFIKNKLIKLGL